MIKKIITPFLAERLRQIDYFRVFPEMSQAKVLKSLIYNLSNTSYGKSLGINSMMTYTDFAKRVPIVTYEQYMDKITDSFDAKSGIISSDKIKWYSKSSGTTSSTSKYLPVTNRFLKRGHLVGGEDTLAILMDNYPENGVVDGKILTLGGSLSTIPDTSAGVVCGDISAIMMHNTPWYAKYSRTPSIKTALIPDFNQKVEQICKECSHQNVTAFAGVPSWNMVMLERILEYNGCTTLPEVWKNIELFIHGGVNFAPYREQYKKLFPNPNMKYIETYNSSEGFFAIQDDKNSDDMLLMMDYDIFYEFIPVETMHDHTTAVPVSGVEKGVNYAMIISTSAGLWRYELGDTVEFTSLHPHKIKITGRTKLFLNVFGEEVIVENCDRAIQRACSDQAASVVEYMVVPKFMEIGSKGRHQWIVELKEEPKDIEAFKRAIDEEICTLNSDYAAKRTNDTTLLAPEFTFVPSGSFYKWYGSMGRLGGQNKVPRLSNSREKAEEFINFAENLAAS